MTFHNNGTITTKEHLTDAQAAEIMEVFKTATIVENTIELSDEPGDIEDDLVELVQWLSEAGNPITDVTVDCYGDYDGGYRLMDGIVTWVDIDKKCINDAETEVLIRELARRGYDCVSTNDEQVSVGTVVRILVNSPDGIFDEAHKGSIGVVVEIEDENYAISEKKPLGIYLYSREQFTVAGKEDLEKFIRSLFNL